MDKLKNVLHEIVEELQHLPAQAKSMLHQKIDEAVADAPAPEAAPAPAQPPAPVTLPAAPSASSEAAAVAPTVPADGAAKA